MLHKVKATNKWLSSVKMLHFRVFQKIKFIVNNIYLKYFSQLFVMVVGKLQIVGTWTSELFIWFFHVRVKTVKIRSSNNILWTSLWS